MISGISSYAASAYSGFSAPTTSQPATTSYSPGTSVQPVDAVGTRQAQSSDSQRTSDSRTDSSFSSTGGGNVPADGSRGSKVNITV